MKKSVLLIVCMVFAVTTGFAKENKKSKGKETVTFQVEGMDCMNCVKKIEKNIAFEKGVTDLKCDLATKTAEVTYRTDKTCANTIASAFKKIGMEALPAGGDGCCAEKENCESSGCAQTGGCCQSNNK